MKNKSVAFFLSMGTGLAAIITLILYIVAGLGDGLNALVVVSLIAIVVAEVLAVYFGNHILTMYLPVLTPVFAALATFTFISDNVGTFVDYFTGVGIFGDTTQIGIITTISVLALITSVLSIATCFVKGESR